MAPSPQNCYSAFFHSHNEKVGRGGGAWWQTRRKDQQSCRQGSLLCSDWSPPEEMVHSFIVPIYTSRSRFTPDPPVHIYTRVVAFASNRTLLAAFLHSQMELFSQQQLDQLSSVFGYYLFPGFIGLVGRVWLWCRKYFLVP